MNHLERINNWQATNIFPYSNQTKKGWGEINRIKGILQVKIKFLIVLIIKSAFCFPSNFSLHSKGFPLINLPELE